MDCFFYAKNRWKMLYIKEKIGIFVRLKIRYYETYQNNFIDLPASSSDDCNDKLHRTA